MSLLGVLSASCSLLQDLDTAQCATTADCIARGARFEGTVCEASLCVTPLSGGDGGTGGANSSGGEAGAGSKGECETNGECIDRNFGSPYICRDEKCVPLTIPEQCPIVLGAGQDNENLRKPSPIIFGAYSFVDPTAPRLSVPTLNYELAIDEVNEATRGGLTGGPDGTLRPFVAVVCSGTNDPDLDKSLAHLIDDLEVPAIVSSLYTRDLLEAFEGKGAQNRVFFLSPLEADSTLTSLEDDGLLWHMLASAGDLSPAYVPLLGAVESELRSKRGLDPADSIKVALVEAKTPFLTDIADDLLGTLEFNGKSALANEDDGNFVRLRIDSELEVPSPDLASALTSLQNFRPDVVVAVASGEAVQLVLNLESSWNPAWGPPPFYLASPYMFGRSDFASSLFASVHSRMLGVNFAAAEQSSLYDLYLSKLESTYNVSFSLEGSENFYDAAYFMMYALAGSGNPPRLTGTEVAVGMTRLLAGKTSFDVGPQDVNDVIGNLRGSASSTISLQGTMGPPEFDTTTGARRGKPSIYCIDGAGSYVQNAMSYDSNTKTLTGSPPCLSTWGE